MAELFNTHQKDRKTKTEIFISGGGEMGELIRSFDWTKTSLGPISQWPLSLRTAVNLILQSTAPLVILWGREGITIYNNAYISFAGLRHPSLLGASCEKIWPEAAEFICNVIKKCHEGESLSYKKFPYTVYRNDIPEDIWMDLDCSPILNDEGEPAGVFIVNIETTDQVRAEQRQRNAEERYDLAMGAAELIGTWDWHIKPDKFYADFRLASLFGIDPEEFKQGLSISEYFSAIHPEDKERVSNAVNLAMKKKEKYSEEYRVIQKDGSIRWIIARGQCTFDREGNPDRFPGVAVDITELKHTEDILAYQSNLNKTFTDNASVGLFIMDAEGRATFMNEAAEKMCGYTFEEVQGKIVHDLIHHKHPDGSAFPIDDCPISKTVFQLDKLTNHEDVFIRKNGSFFPVLCSATTIAEKGELKGIILEVQDLTERKHTEKALKENEDHYKFVEKATNEGIWDWNIVNNTLRWNSAAFRIYEYKQGEVTPSFDIWLNMIHPEDKEGVMGNLDTAQKSNEPYMHNEYRLLGRNGKVTYVVDRAYILRNQHGKPVRMIGSMQDITKRKQAEQALKEKEHRYRTLIEEATVATGLYIGRELRIQYVNEIMIGYWGKDKSVIGKTFHEAVPELEGQPFFDLLDKVYITGEPYIGIEEKADLIVDGKLQTFYFNFTYKALRNKEGEIFGIHHMAMDVTSQVLAKKALKESEERFRIMADASPHIIWALNPDSSLRYVNKFALDFLGITMEKFIEDNWIPYIHPEDLDRTIQTLTEAIKERKIYSMEQRLLRHDGEYRWILAQGAPSYYPNGELYGYVGSSVDITDRKQAEKALELKNSQLIRINNDLDNFIYTASHDLKAPISNIEGLVNVLEQSLEDDSMDKEEEKRLLELIFESINRFKNTIKDLTEVAKVQSDGNEDLSKISFKDMVEEVKLNIKGLIDESHAQIMDDFSKAPAIYFSKKNLRSILYNLVSNAIKYRSPDRPVRINITSALSEDYLLLTVQDNGLGIREEDKPKVFTMFKRLHQHVEGTGIGLSIVKKIIDNTGGKIEVESEVGKGTLFKIYFKV